MVFEHTDYRRILADELRERIEINSRYSLRAFAKRLGVPPSTLSDVLNARQGLSRARAMAFAQILGYSKQETEYFVDLVDMSDARSASQREMATARIEKFHKGREKKLNQVQWDLLSNWYYPTLIELTKTESFRSNPAWIARKLGISTLESRQAVATLLRLELLTKDQDGRLQATGRWLLMSPQDIPSKSIQKVHSEILQRAIAGIRNQSVDKRNYNVMMASIDEAVIPKAKKMIQKFNKDLNALITSSEKRERVYCFSSQFFCLEEEAGHA